MFEKHLWKSDILLVKSIFLEVLEALGNEQCNSFVEHHVKVSWILIVDFDLPLLTRIPYVKPNHLGVIKDFQNDKYPEYFPSDFEFLLLFSPLSGNLTKWSSTLKQFVGNLSTKCLSVFDHLMGLALKGLNSRLNLIYFANSRRSTVEEWQNFPDPN